jgi:hypothetical protein
MDEFIFFWCYDAQNPLEIPKKKQAKMTKSLDLLHIVLLWKTDVIAMVVEALFFGGEERENSTLPQS